MFNGEFPEVTGYMTCDTTKERLNEEADIESAIYEVRHEDLQKYKQYYSSHYFFVFQNVVLFIKSI